MIEIGFGDIGLSKCRWIIPACELQLRVLRRHHDRDSPIDAPVPARVAKKIFATRSHARRGVKGAP